MPEPNQRCDAMRCDALLVCADVCSILMTSLLLRYDLVDLGRDVLARLTTPISQNFTTSLGNASTRVDAAECARSGKLYVELLMDLDTLVVGEIAHRTNCPTPPLVVGVAVAVVWLWQFRPDATAAVMSPVCWHASSGIMLTYTQHC